MLDKRRFYIRGEWVDPIRPDLLPVVNPATGCTVAVISRASSPDVDRAFVVAGRALPSYSHTSVTERLEMLARLEDVYTARCEELARRISLGTGTPISVAVQRARAGLVQLHRCQEALERLGGRDLLSNRENLPEPTSVICIIASESQGIDQILSVIVQALADGCTLVLNPSELTPLGAMYLAEMIDEADFAAGVFNLVIGTEAEFRSALSRYSSLNIELIAAAPTGLRPETGYRTPACD